jgi:2-polyprenyl-6-methoxyphenol hydroxylase-like FAD-dependent oxidoreductase
VTPPEQAIRPGAGLSLTSRDVRALTEKLLSTNNWHAAAQSYAEEHDRYLNVTREVGQWLFDLFLARGPEYDRLRERALPRLMTEPDRVRIISGSYMEWS